MGDAHAYVSELGLEPRRLRDLDTYVPFDLESERDEVLEALRNAA